MDNEQRNHPKDEPEKYEAPAGRDLGTVAELTASVCFPSVQRC